MRKTDYAIIVGLILAALSLWAWQRDLAKREAALPMSVSSVSGTQTQLNILGISGTQTFQVGKPLQVQLRVEKGTPPYHWYVQSGEMPPGIKLDEQTGLIYGTPLPEALSKTYQFVVAVNDSEGRHGVAH